jgi:RNA polymerase sigma factor for flagellar operon FliA
MQAIDMWKEYSQNKNTENRNELIMEYIEVVDKIVNMQMRLFHTFNPDLKDEFYSIGVLGLIDAVQRFDYKKNVKFETYASFRIRGAIKDYIRKQDIVSRGIREKEKAIKNAIENLTHRLKREPTDQEVMEELNMDSDEYHQTMSNLAQSDLLSFEEMIGGGIGVKTEDESVEGHLEKKELEEALVRAITDLPERDQMIISLYYKDELKLKEIGQVLKISESRVSQILKKIVNTLRESLEDYILV